MTKQNYKLKLVLLAIILYVSVVSFAKMYNVEEYVLYSSTFVVFLSIILFDKFKPFLSLIEILSIVIFKVIEILTIIRPDTVVDYFVAYYFYLDDIFLSSILFIIFSREVGYHPFKMDANNLRKYILTFIVSYLTIVFIV